MTKVLENLLERIGTWPKEAREEAVRSMLDIEKRHVPLYRLSDDERAEIDEALAEWERGEIADEREVTEFFQTHSQSRP